MVALVALPLALGFGVASGVGAAAGITTAIVAGILAAIFGGSNVQVSGPTGAMTVVLIPIVANHGADGGACRRRAGGAHAALAGVHRRWPQIPWEHLDSLLLTAIAVAALGALESLLSATVADAMTVGDRHNPDRELFGQGVANVAIARTAVNVRAGAGTRLAAVFHSLLLLVAVLVAARWVGEIPLAALAGVLIATAIQMIHPRNLRSVIRATKGDGATLLITAAATVVFDLVVAVLIGLVMAGFFALRDTARTAVLEAAPLDEGDHRDNERELLDEHIAAFRMEGPLFFGAAHDFLLELADASSVKVVVLRMRYVTTIDATGAQMLADTIGHLERRGTTVLLAATKPEHIPVLRELGVFDQLAHGNHVFDNTPDAIAHARLHASRIQHEEAGGEHAASQSNQHDE